MAIKGVNTHCDWSLESATVVFSPINKSLLDFVGTSVDIHDAKCSSFIMSNDYKT